MRSALDDQVSDVLVVDSNTSAIEMLRKEPPDLILLSSLLSPTDEDELFEVLRALPDTEHVQTLHIPQLRTGVPAQRRSKFSLFRGRQASESEGCSPDVFAGEVREYLDRATELKAELGNGGPAATAEPSVSAAAVETVDPASTVDVAESAQPDLDPDARQEPSIWLDAPVALADPPGDHSAGAIPSTSHEAADQAAVAEAPAAADDSREDVIAAIRREVEAKRDQEVRQAREQAAVEAAEALAADKRQHLELARIREETERAYATELERARSEAASLHAAELAKVQEESERLRQEAFDEGTRRGRGRSPHPRGRARAGAHGVRGASGTRGRACSSRGRGGEDGRARRSRGAGGAEREAALRDVQAATEAAAAKALEEELARLRDDSERHLAEELERARQEADQARVALEAEAEARAKQIREETKKGSSQRSVQLWPVSMADKSIIFSDLRGWRTPSVSGEELQAHGKSGPR